MFSRYFIFSSIVVSFLTLLPGFIIQGNSTEANAVLAMIDNPARGKTYWIYANRVNYSEAVETCEKNGQELLQLPTEKEQSWVNENLSDDRQYWVGIIKFGGQYFWKVPNGRIPVDSKRFFSRIITNSQFSAHEDHIHDSLKGSKNFVICQQEYPQKEGNFENLKGKYQFRQRIMQLLGGKFQCASKCMMLVKCKVFLLDYRKGYCEIYGGFTASHLKEDGVDCNSSSRDCFSRVVFTSAVDSVKD